MPSRDALMLPDVLTEGDNLEMPPMPDATFLLSQMEDETHSRRRRAGSRDINLQEDYTSSQFLQNSIDDNDALIMDPEDEFDLGLDLDLDFNPKVNQSIEIGRDAPAPRATEDDLLSEIDLQLPTKDNLGDRDMSLNLNFGGDDGVRMGEDDGDVDMYMGDGDVTLPVAPLIRPGRISESPLSDIDEALAQEVEADHQRTLLNSALYEPEDETEESVFRNPAQRARKQKLLKMDQETSLSKAQIIEQQQNHDKILRPQMSLPRDPELLALMEMQKNGGFVSSVMGEGRSSRWAPELRGMLSLDAARNLKRKHDSAVTGKDSENEQGPSKEPRLDLGEEEEELAGLARASMDRANTTIGPDGTVIEMAGDDGLNFNMDDEHDPSAGLDGPSPGPNFDETIAPLVHPADSGPVSLGTKHAVHLLRDRFGPEAANSPDKRKKASVLFHDLLPESKTSRADATKMFFEVLVLATKDAVKVEQQEALLGGPIRVRGKRGLWGDWAEREAGGEIEVEGGLDAAGPSDGLAAPVQA